MFNEIVCDTCVLIVHWLKLNLICEVTDVLFSFRFISVQLFLLTRNKTCIWNSRWSKHISVVVPHTTLTSERKWKFKKWTWLWRRLRLHGDVYRRNSVADFCFTLTKLNSRKMIHLRSSLIVSKRWTLAVQWAQRALFIWLQFTFYGHFVPWSDRSNQ